MLHVWSPREGHDNHAMMPCHTCNLHEHQQPGLVACCSTQLRTQLQRCTPKQCHIRFNRASPSEREPKVLGLSPHPESHLLVPIPFPLMYILVLQLGLIVKEQTLVIVHFLNDPHHIVQLLHRECDGPSRHVLHSEVKQAQQGHGWSMGWGDRMCSGKRSKYPWTQHTPSAKLVVTCPVPQRLLDFT